MIDVLATDKTRGSGIGTTLNVSISQQFSFDAFNKCSAGSSAMYQSHQKYLVHEQCGFHGRHTLQVWIIHKTIDHSDD